MNNSKGFTLIELLVVIAIIGILSTIAMTSLNGARKKAADASFKASVASIQSTAVICCDTAAGLDTSVSAGDPICADGTGGTYPSTGIGTIDVDTTGGYGTDGCDAGAFKITINVPTGFNGNCTSGICDETKCTFTGTGC
jgi:prepilin-type N-terminal cleavage/methylation domain-containing protein